MIFEINNNDIHIENFYGSKIYTIKDFYKYPDKVSDFINHYPLKYWKETDSPSYNKILFHDRRHEIVVDEFIEVTNFLSTVCGQSTQFKDKIFTNTIKFKKHKFNDYKNNYWRPHLDLGYNALVYFNTFNCDGTNIYESLGKGDSKIYPEHYKPWVNKKDWKILKTIKSCYNTLVLFDGKKFYHGMAINDDSFFQDILRFNQVVFFEEKV
jgi:hypothetical protein